MEEPTGTTEHPAYTSVQTNDLPVPVAPPEARRRSAIGPQAGGGACNCGEAAGWSSNGGKTASYVYAIGQVEARFPNLSAEKEFAQASGRTDTAGKPIRRPSTPCWPTGKTATWCASCVGC